jgi:hypothetical protein
MSVDDQPQPNRTLDEVAASWLELIHDEVQRQLQEALPKLKEEIKAELRAESLKQKQS